MHIAFIEENDLKRHLIVRICREQTQLDLLKIQQTDKDNRIPITDPGPGRLVKNGLLIHQEHEEKRKINEGKARGTSKLCVNRIQEMVLDTNTQNTVKGNTSQSLLEILC